MFIIKEKVLFVVVHQRENRILFFIKEKKSKNINWAKGEREREAG